MFQARLPSIDQARKESQVRLVRGDEASQPTNQLSSSPHDTRTNDVDYQRREVIEDGEFTLDMEGRYWWSSTNGQHLGRERESKQAAMIHLYQGLPLSLARLWSRRYMPTYLTASVSQSVSQSVSHPCLPDYLTTLLCLPVCLPACLSACSLAFSRYISLHDKYYLPSPLLNTTPVKARRICPLPLPSLTLLYLKPDASKWKEAVVVTVLVYKMTILPSIHSTPGRFHILRLL